MASAADEGILTKNPTSIDWLSPEASLGFRVWWRSASLLRSCSGSSSAAGELAGTRSAALARGALDFNSRTESREGLATLCWFVARYRTVSPTFFSHWRT